VLTDAVAPSSFTKSVPGLLEIVFFRFHLSVSKDVVVADSVKVLVGVYLLILG
jgi:hypothetical protein